MFFIVIIHAAPFRGLGPSWNMLNFILDCLTRFAVPFFFLTSGYFFAVQISEQNPMSVLQKQSGRIGAVYILGICLYLPVGLMLTAGEATIANGTIISALQKFILNAIDPIELFYYGNSVVTALWFLPALIYSLVVVAVFARYNSVRLLLGLAFLLHLVGIAGQAFLLLPDFPINTRDALFFGLFYTSLGFYIYGRDPTGDNWQIYLGAFIGFNALQIVERYIMGYYIVDGSVAGYVYTPNYSVATVFVATSLFLFTLSVPNLFKNTRLPKLGAYAVGIYIVHPAVWHGFLGVREMLAALTGVNLGNTLAWHFLITPLIYTLSFAIFYLLANTQFIPFDRRARVDLRNYLDM